MDDDGVTKPRIATDVASCTTTGNVASNECFVAFANNAGITILESSSGQIWRLNVPFHGSQDRTRPVLSFSPLLPEFLAVSRAHQVLVFDVVRNVTQWTIPGIARTVSSLCWSHRDPHVLLTGTTAGAVCAWNLCKPSLPLYRLDGPKKLCSSIAFNAIEDNLCVVNHRDELRIWDTKPHPRLTTTLSHNSSGFEDVAWHPMKPGRLLAYTHDNELKIYDLKNATTEFRDVDTTFDSDDDEEFVLELGEFTHSRLELLVTYALESSPRSLFWLGQTGVMLLMNEGRTALFLELHEDRGELVQLWQYRFEKEVQSLSFTRDGGDIKLLAYHTVTVDSYDVPTSVVQSIQWADDPTGHFSGDSLSSTAKTHAFSTVNSTSQIFSGHNHREEKTFKMSSETITKIKARRSEDPKRLDLTKQQSSRYQPQRSEQELIRAESLNAAVSQTPTIQETTPDIASLHLGLGHGDWRASSLLFEKVVAGAISYGPPKLPRPTSVTRLPNSSFESSLPSTDINHDSDSDDETFVDVLAGSGTLLPGGVHVPLPKACGALFAPTGQLLVYFPSHPRLSSAGQKNNDPNGVPKRQESRANREDRLFPSFSNLFSDNLYNGSEYVDDFPSDIDSPGEQIVPGEPNLLQHPSFGPEQGWNSKCMPKANRPGDALDDSITITVTHLPGIADLFPTQRQLAKKYRLLCKKGEAGSQVCLDNAAAAHEYSCHDAAEIWEFMAMLLDEKVPLDLLHGSIDEVDAVVFARQAQTFVRRDSGISVAEHREKTAACGKLYWTGHPLGSAWFVRIILTWAERKGDIQMLACICAVLAGAQDHTSDTTTLPSHSIFRQLLSYPTESATMSTEASTDLTFSRSSIVPNIIPILRANSGVSGYSMEDSPVKTPRSDSGNTSRNHSQPVTPYLDSPGSNPPAFAWSSLSRQSTRLSSTYATVPISSSTSPDVARGSFSAAAKYYAQSITDRFADKFASYGTSPPIPKGSLSKSSSSPKNHEQLSSGLSSSLPRGSLNKSVSFASTDDTRPTDRLSRSYDAQEENRRSTVAEEAVDGDRGLAHRAAAPAPSPGGPKGKVTVKLKNQEAFTDEVSGKTQSCLIPEDLKLHSVIWMEHYAELLRTWDLHLEATDLEKIASLMSGSTDAFSQHAEDACGITTHAVPKQVRYSAEYNRQKKDSLLLCAICSTVEAGIQQTCPACRHTAHLACLEEYLAAIWSLQPTSLSGHPDVSLLEPNSYSCPTGCGCNCADQAYVEYEPSTGPLAMDFEQWHLRETPARAGSVRTVVKKRSFTDPRRWRARVEGDSW